MNDDGTYSRDFSTEGKGVEMLSNKDGQFNVKGLDAGTYYLKETTLLPVTVPVPIKKSSFLQRTT